MSGFGSNNGRRAPLQLGLASPFNRAAKRLFDIVVTLVLLALLAPIFGVVALIIKVCGGPVYSADERVGLGGRSFRCLRFRTTTYANDTNPTAASRLTMMGSFLRLTGIDALPQLINVLRGEMSLVGSCPVVRRETFEKDRIDRQGIVRPGLTGLWRVSGRQRSDAAFIASLDQRYAQDWSLWADVLILIRSMPDIVSGPGRSASRATNASREP